MTNLVSFTETRRVYYACIGLQKFYAVKFTVLFVISDKSAIVELKQITYY